MHVTFFIARAVRLPLTQLQEAVLTYKAAKS
jgi:hypothetical protein